MGCCCGGPVDFQNASDGKTDDVVTRKRTSTDGVFMYVMYVYLLIHVALIGYCVWFGDISRLSKKKKSSENASAYEEWDIGYDLSRSWDFMIYLALIATLTSFVVLLTLRYATKCIMWTVIGGGIIACFASSALFAYMYMEKGHRTEYLVLAVIILIVSIVVCFLAYFLLNRIQMMILLFEEANKAMARMPCMLSVPFFTFLLCTANSGLHFYCMLWVESSGRARVIQDTVDEIQQEPVTVYDKDFVMYLTRFTNLMAFLWLSLFIVGCQHMVIAGAVARWYFTRDKRELRRPICTSFGTMWMYHLGTVAFGSLILALVHMLRFLMEHLRKNEDNDVVHAILYACSCLVSMFESVLQYLTLNSYIETAISGEPFCKAGKVAFGLITSNLMQVTAINTFGSWVLCAAKLTIFIVTILFGYLMFRTRPDVQMPFVPVLLCAVFALLVAIAYLSVYEMCIDTLFICFCKDCEMNDGSPGRPYYMDKGLMMYVEDAAHIAKEEKEVHDRKLREMSKR